MDVTASFATKLYDSALKLSAPPAQESQAGGESFAQTMAEAARALIDTVETGEAAAIQAVSGQGDVQAVVEALSATELALQTATTVRDRVVQAYQDVLRMPV